MNMNGESERVLIPEGWHNFTIISIEDGYSKAGNQMFTVGLELVSGRGTIDVYCVAEKGKRWMLKQLLDACGIVADEEGNYNWDLPDVKHASVQARIEHEPSEWIDRSGNSQSTVQGKVKEFKRMET